MTTKLCHKIWHITDKYAQKSVYIGSNVKHTNATAFQHSADTFTISTLLGEGWVGNLTRAAQEPKFKIPLTT